MIHPTLEEVKALAAEGSYRTVPVSAEILSDIRTPIEVLRILKNVSGHCYLLESAADAEKWGRYTFLGFDPKLEITCTDGNMKVGALSFQTDDPGAYIRQVLQEYKGPRLPGLPPFTGGLVGYFSFDYIKYAEPSLKLDAKDTEGFRDVDLMLFDKVIAFDHFRQKIILIVTMAASSEGMTMAACSAKEWQQSVSHPSSETGRYLDSTTRYTPQLTISLNVLFEYTCILTFDLSIRFTPINSVSKE